MSALELTIPSDAVIGSYLMPCLVQSLAVSLLYVPPVLMLF